MRLAADQGTGPGLHGRDRPARSATVIPVSTPGRNRPVPGPPSGQLRQLTVSAAADLGRPALHHDRSSVQQIMTDAPAQLPSARPPRTPAAVRDVMRPTAPTAEPNDHAAAAAYLMKHVGATALVVVDPVTGQPASIITETGITHAVANGENLDEARIHDLMTTRPAGPRARTPPLWIK